MGGTISRIFSPGAAKFMVSNTNSALLKSALQNYIKAVNNLNNNARTENKLIAMMNNTRIGLTNSYKKRIANAIASIVAKVPRVAAKAAEAAAGAAPVTPAAVAVNNLANKIKNLNAFINTIKGGDTAAQVNAYIAGGRNAKNNRALNAGRGARYATLFNAVNIAQLNKKIANINSQLPKGAQGTPADLGVVRNTVNGLGQTTYVPTKIEISVVLHPLQTRQQVSQGFSLEGFAQGRLLKGGFW
jgi:hypothetical protein